MIIGIGIDILSIERLRGVILRRGSLNLARRICCPREFIEFKALPRIEDVQLRFLASRWTAKEAAYKALPFPRVTWKSLDLRYMSNGRPTLHYISRTTEEKVTLLLSLSGDAGVVVGVVVVESKSTK
ncbi:holo-[acyl-carrier-protein] synthase [Tremella mesenterica]|uniref:Holo-[acyl-carrier-protein] synthase n=1 Tax=Tremella mesenterica TaxID=5217 RepID=A0A4Q1BLD5_TREME|nr:holo-[acyl-carrier-protein] synthase [Tremella mesenterica]